MPLALSDRAFPLQTPSIRDPFSNQALCQRLMVIFFTALSPSHMQNACLFIDLRI